MTNKIPEIDMKIKVLNILKNFRERAITMEEAYEDIRHELHRYEGRMHAESMENTPNND